MLKNVLLVEDNPGDAMLVKGAIGLLDPCAGVTHVTTLREAMLELAKAQPDLVLLDLHLPDSQGAQTFQRVLAKAGESPVVVLTSTADDALGLQAIASGVQDYLSKGSVDEISLRRSIRYAQERKRLEVELHKANAKLEQLVQVKTEDLEHSVVALGEEVSGHERAEEDLREARGRFYEMLDAMPTAFWMFSPQTRRVLYCNTCYASAVGWNRDQIYERPSTWLEAVHPDDRPEVEAEFEKWLGRAWHARESALELRFRVRQPSGKDLRQTTRIFAVYAPSGQLQCICGMAEESPATGIDDGLIVLDSQGRVKRWEAQGMSGIPAAQAEGKYLHDLLAESNPDAWSHDKHAIGR